MLYLHKIIQFPKLSGIYLPFKVYHPSGIKIRKSATIQLGGRITLGNPDKEKAIVSRLPINIYFGNQSKVTIGQSVSVGPGVNLIVKDQAQLIIGNNTYFTSDLHLEAVNSIEIGNDCAISWGVTIIDDDHHQLISEQTHSKNQVNHITIGHHVWVGCNVTILKGTQIGNNCVVAAGSVVKGAFPDGVLIAGNPAKVVKQSINWK
jgi:acetyltransferase-like isoleucine patch superfamily enzyme